MAVGQTVGPGSGQGEDWLHRAMDGVAAGALAVWEFYAHVTTSSERSQYFVVLEVGPRPGASIPSQLWSRSV